MGVAEELFEKFNKKSGTMENRVSIIPTDPRFNALHWLMDCRRLAWQVEFSVHGMKEQAARHQKAHPPGSQPSHSNVLVSYYADNAITRLVALRDKLGLCLLSYFSDFDPYKAHKLDSLESAMASLLDSQRAFGKGAAHAVEILVPLKTNMPKILKTYRDYKTHRREPRIEIYGVAPHHDWSYVVPVRGAAEEAVFIRDLCAGTTHPGFAKARAKSCKRFGLYYRTLPNEENKRLMAYEDIARALESYRRVTYAAAYNACVFLARRAPFRKR